ncbi:hypothetical protein Aglo02_33480 [Actinokineospora globicatena]|nr:hypothetical protein Aglo02_33480 [Actinokineospora globicatena]
MPLGTANTSSSTANTRNDSRRSGRRRPDCQWLNVATLTRHPRCTRRYRIRSNPNPLRSIAARNTS